MTNLFLITKNSLEHKYLDECEKCKMETEDICGHMSMTYFLYDPIQVEEVNVIANLYGGSYEQKYIKYKNKYLTLKKLIK